MRRGAEGGGGWKFVVVRRAMQCDGWAIARTRASVRPLCDLLVEITEEKGIRTYQFDPYTTYREYPSFLINLSNTSAVSLNPNPSTLLVSLNPNPGILGATT